MSLCHTPHTPHTGAVRLQRIVCLAYFLDQFIRTKASSIDHFLKMAQAWLLVTLITSFLIEPSFACFLFPQRLSQPRFPDGPGDGTLIDYDEKFQVTRKDETGIFNSLKKFLVPDRAIKVWLPPGYFDDSNIAKTYPVIYCHDGQNAINDEDSWTGNSFRLAGALTELIRNNDKGFINEPIVVLIPSASEDFIPGIKRRHLEYGDGIFGELYVDSLVKNLKPQIDKSFRTKNGADHTFSIGSSLGGQISYLSVMRYPDIFGGAAGLSPCFQAGLLTQVLLEGQKLKGKRLYLDNGGDVGDIRVPLIDPLDHISNWNPGYFWLDSQLQPGIDAIRGALSFHNISHEYCRYPGGRHNEREWSRRIDKALLHLLFTESNTE